MTFHTLFELGNCRNRSLQLLWLLRFIFSDTLDKFR